MREKPPRGEDWVYEIKADGYRAQLHLRDGDAKVYSRTGLDWTEQFSSIAAAAHQLKANSAIIDGEAVVYGGGGLPDFQQLRRELGSKRSERVRYHAFDLLYLDGYDLRGVVYEDRKRLLQRLLKDAPETFIYVEALAADGHVIFDKGCKLGLEGLVAKRLGQPYRSGRQESWIKLKCKKSETFPIVAFVEKLGARPRKVASLYVGRRENGKLLYAGKVRTGYTETTARELRERLDPLIRKTSPLHMAVKKPKATWVEPTLEIEVQYGALTDDGLLREAVFKGFRDDLTVRKVKAPRLVPSVAGRPRSWASPERTSCSFCPKPLLRLKNNSQNIGPGSGRRRCRTLGIVRSSWCVTCTARPSITRGCCRRTFRPPCTSSTFRSARAAKALACGSTASMASLVSSRSALSSCTRGMRPPRTSNMPTAS
ncbi:DNA ligase D-like protein (predicted ligase) [Bradyrhizobium sp. LB7.2]